MGQEEVEAGRARAREALEAWRIPEARRLLTALASRLRDPGLLEDLSLCHDLEGRPGEADRVLREAAARDPEGHPFPPRMSPDRFKEVVQEALEELPSDLREALGATPVVIQPVPHRELLGGGRAGELPPDLLGLFLGASRMEESHLDGPQPSPVILLFQRNLERCCSTVEELKAEIRTTLFHEIGHRFGFDEGGVEGLGLG